MASSEKATIKPWGRALIKTGLIIEIPDNTYARIAPRSGLALPCGINIGAGVIDYDYREEVGIILLNHNHEEFTVNPKDRIAQLILEKIEMATCEEKTDLTTTMRGTSGFGSTGYKNVYAKIIECDKIYETRTNQKYASIFLKTPTKNTVSVNAGDYLLYVGGGSINEEFGKP